MAGIGSAALDVSMELARNACDSGVAAMVLPPPYLCPYQQDDICEFYVEFAKHSFGPVYLEHQPELTTGITVDTARELLAAWPLCGCSGCHGENMLLLRRRTHYRPRQRPAFRASALFRRPP